MYSPQGLWLSTPTLEAPELRDSGLLKLFFGAEPQLIASAQVEVHERKLEEYERTRARLRDIDLPGPLLTLEAGIRVERERIRFWRELA